MLLATILSRFIYYNWKPSFVDFLPSSFCSTMGFVLPLFILFCKKDSKTLYFAVFAAFMGGVITVLLGDDIGQVKYSKTKLNKVPRLFVSLCIMVVYGLFTNQVFGFSNNMYFVYLIPQKNA